MEGKTLGKRYLFLLTPKFEAVCEKYSRGRTQLLIVTVPKKQKARKKVLFLLKVLSKDGFIHLFKF